MFARLLLTIVVAEGAAQAPSSRQPEVAAEAADSLRARLEEATTLVARRANAEGLKILLPLLPLIEAAGNDALVLETVHQTALAHQQLSEYGVALPLWERSLELSRAQKNRRLEAETLRRMGALYKNTGNYPKSLRCSQQALAIFLELGDRKGAARVWLVIGAAHDLMGQYSRALEAYETARPALEETKDRSFYVLLNEIAITYLNLGRYEDALAAHSRALEWNRQTGDKFEQQVSLNNLGAVYDEMGQYERALEHYREGLALCSEIQEKRGAAIILGAMAQAWNRLGDPRQALDHAQQQLQLARELGLRHIEGRALYYVAEAQVLLGSLAQGRAGYEQALAVWRETGAQGSEELTLLALADLHLREGHSEEARQQAEQALALGRQSQAPETDWLARFALARVARSQGRAHDAAAGLRASLDVIEGLRGRVLTDTGKIGFLDARQAVFHELVDLLSEKDDPAEALEVAEAARSRALSDLLAGRPMTAKPHEAETLVVIRELETRLRAQAHTNPSEATARAELAQTRAATEQDLEARVSTLRSEDPELASLVVAESVTAEQIRAAARERQATILEYLVTESRLFIWVVSPGGKVANATVPVGRARLRELAAGLLRQMDGVDLAALRDPQRVRAVLTDLYQLLIAPIVAHLPRDPGARVYVVPHDALLLVPFAALVDAQGRYVVETHTLATTPSVGVLRYTAAKKARVLRPDRPRLLALADPRPPDGASVDALPGAREEVRLIGRHFPGGRSITLVGEGASEANGKRLAPGQTILHFAVHGRIEDGRPWDSALILAAGDGEDGFLRVSEAFGLDLRADLVVLSGCSTGRGKLTGDGILGLSRALLYAGTPSVVVSQWDVSDVATSFLMDRFYAGLRAERGKAEALRRAQLEALRRYPHPALWAAFVLVGEAD
jgi:CHAT domain-containing protein